LAADGDDLWTLGECAASAEELGDAARARGYLERGLAIEPGNPGIERALGLLLMRSGDPGGRELLARALERNPEDPEVLRALQGEGAAPVGDPPR
jgi:hypothetical protein